MTSNDLNLLLCGKRSVSCFKMWHYTNVPEKDQSVMWFYIRISSEIMWSFAPPWSFFSSSSPCGGYAPPFFFSSSFFRVSEGQVKTPRELDLSCTSTLWEFSEVCNSQGDSQALWLLNCCITRNEKVPAESEIHLVQLPVLYCGQADVPRRPCKPRMKAIALPYERIWASGTILPLYRFHS